MNWTRRDFMRNGVAVSTGFAALRNLTGCEKVGDATAEAKADKPMFRLPSGFEYTVISTAGKVMSDGLNTPGMHDGMCAFRADNGQTILVCNHELDSDKRTGPFGEKSELLGKIDRDLLYDRGTGNAPPALGGTTTLVYDAASRQVVREYLSLCGTLRNCAGGPTHHRSWITCEESVQGAEGNYECDHGYNFEVLAQENGGLQKAVALKAMGRFNHEAIAQHINRPHIIYQTEDRGDGLIYRFIANDSDDFTKGGRLQALRVRDKKSLDTRNWKSTKIKPGQKMDVDWVELGNVESPDDELRLEGFFGLGAARFARGEGMWYGRGAVYFACTNGGMKRNGQIWRYIPSLHEGDAGERNSPGKLELFIESDNGNISSNADNLTMAPWGDVFVCEDNGNSEKKLLRVTQSGKVIEFGRNILNSSELAGVTFSRDTALANLTLFVNIQNPGITLAINGRWDSLEDFPGS